MFTKHLHLSSVIRAQARIAVLAAVLVAGSAGAALAANTSDFTQSITAGTLATDIRDASGVTVGSPSVAFSSKPFSMDCLSGGNASTGTFGTNAQRIYVDNPDAADNGWSLALAATGGATSTWTDGGSTYDFNDGSGGTAGCGDGADADSRPGQMTLNPNAGTITADCGSCATTNISKGSQASFAQGTTDSVTLLTGASSSNDIGRWYLTGVGGSQTIPAEQAAGSYTLNMTLTVTAS